MITILNGKLTIPESERFIGFAGDNLRRTVNFLISGASEADHIYRLYLTFDDGTVNYFTLPSTVTDEGVVLTWNVLIEHIFMSGSVKAQIKAFSHKGVVYHTTTDRFFVGDSAEFSDYFRKQNSEFLEYEEKLNNLRESVSDICVLMPFVGDNGNWYIYDADSGEYKDSGNPSVGLVDNLYVKTDMIEDNAVTGDKIASDSVDYNHLKDMSVTPEKLDRGYVRLHQSGVGSAIRSESHFHNYLVTGAANEIDDLEKFRKICMFSVGATDGVLSVMGTGRFYGFYISKSAFTFTRLGVNPQTFLALWNAEKITSIELVGDNAVADQSYIPTSENAQSGIAVNEAFEIFKEQYQQIKKVTLEEVSYMALLEQLKTFGAIRFNTGGQDFTGSSTDLNLPRGEYLAFYNGSSSYCLELTSAIAYRFSGHDLFDTGEYTFSVSSPLWETQTNLSKLFRSLGDIDTALDNIIATQESYIGGVSE